MKQINFLPTLRTTLLLVMLLFILPAKADYGAYLVIDGIRYSVTATSQDNNGPLAAKATVVSGGTYKGDITIPSSIIWTYGFYTGGGYVTREIECPVTAISAVCFSYCTELTSVSIPNSVTTIGGGAFQYCRSLKSIVIPNSVTELGGEAFLACSNMKSVTIGNSVQKIDKQTFRECTSLTSVVIPNSVTAIGLWAFRECSNLTSVTIPNSVTSIDGQAFMDCSSLLSVTIPNSVEIIPNRCFYGCSSLENVYIPNSVKTIEGGAFHNCKSLSDVSIPNSVTTLGGQAFCGCSSLVRVTLPNSISTLSDYTFSGCTSLPSVDIPNTVTTIGDDAFNGCSSLDHITFPHAVTSIGYRAFMNCTGLMSVTCLSETPPSANNTTFSIVTEHNATLNVPAGSLYEYQTTYPWASFYHIEPIPQYYYVSLDQTNAVIEEGGFVVLNATVTPDDGTAPGLTWSSSNPSVATVDGWGIVTAVGTGDAIITARAGEAYARCHVKVVHHTVSLDLSSATIEKYQTLQLHATVTPDDEYAPSVTWSSSRPGVATVSSDGLVKGYMTGTATITATAGQSTAECVVTVIPISANAITLNEYEKQMTVGGVFRLIATVHPEMASNRDVVWTMSPSDAISISSWDNDCIVMGLKDGQATVTATTTDGTNLSASCLVIVDGGDPVVVPVESISVSPSSLTIPVGANRQLTANVLPANATNKLVIWTSKDESVATVSATGQVTSHKIGTARITATTTDGTNLSASCWVTVTNGGGEEPLLGDVDDDGNVNINDLSALIDYLLTGNEEGVNLVNADVDQDGAVNISDLSALIDLLLNQKKLLLVSADGKVKLKTRPINR